MNMEVQTPSLRTTLLTALALLLLALSIALLAHAQPDSCLYHFSGGALYDCSGNLLLP